MSEQDIIDRQKRVLPRWFPDDSPVLDGVLAGFAHVGTAVSGMLDFAKLQTRIRTATDGFLDLIAFDFFGLRFQRRLGQLDDSFRQAVIDEIFRPRATRPGVISAAQALTGRPTTMIEPANPTDCGGYDVGGCGYEAGGAWGSLDLPYQAFLTVLRPGGAGIPDVAGYDDGPGGFDEGGAIEFADEAMIRGPVTDKDIYRTIDITKPAGTVMWTDIESSPPYLRLDDDFLLDQGTLA